MISDFNMASDFVSEIQRQMNEEFKEIKTTPSQFSFENYLVYKSSLAKITDHSNVYKQMLSSISSAYDSEIMRLNESRRRCSFSKDRDKDVEDASETVVTLSCRVDQLKATVEALESENFTLCESIESMKELAAVMSAQTLLVEEDAFKNTVLENMTLEQMTNVNLLSRELGKLEQQHQAMLEAQTCEFVIKEKFEEARSSLLKKEEIKEELQEDIAAFHRYSPALKHIIDTLQTCNPDMHFEDMLERAKSGIGNVLVNKSNVVELFDDEDPAKEKEAEEALAYIEHLEEMLRDGNYYFAAVHAANSPNGFLRTMNTVEEFKSVSDLESEVSPLFVYCNVLMETVPQFTVPPQDQSFECVQAALKESRFDLIAQWIANKHLELSRAMADMLLCNCQCRARCDCESGTLALAVYRSIKDHELSIHCLARQGALYRAIHYAKTQEMGESKLLALLKALPSIDLAALLILEEEINISEVLAGLQENHNDNIFIGLLKVLYESNDLKDALMNDTSLDSEQWSDFINICIDIGEQEIAEELQGYVISADALSKAIDVLSPSEPTEPLKE